jgi:ferritin
MALGKKVGELLIKQVAEEYTSAYMYMGMAAVLKEMGLDGCASWMMRQAKEEAQHAMKVFNHLQDRGAKIKLLPINPPRGDWRAPLQIFDEMLKHEQRITAMITAIHESALAERDYASQNFISWFITEQVEEEATANALVNKLKKMQATDLGVIMFDDELAKRT